MTNPLTHVFAATLLGVTAATAIAQPQPFVSLGNVTAPSAPVGATQSVLLPPTLFNFGLGGQPGETFTVRWLRFNLTAPIGGELYLDVESRFFSLLSQTPGDSTLALYDTQGGLVAANNGADGLLSFGSNGPRGTGGSGQNGATLPAGRYWLAVVAGGAGSVTTGAAGWAVSTSTSYPLGLITPGTYFATLSIDVGNTTPGGPPLNDTCAGATAVTDTLDPAIPAWTGDAINATLESTSACYPSPSVQALKDVWFFYVPTADGQAEVIAENGGAGSGRPYLTRYGAECGSAAEQCVGGESLSPNEPVKLSFPVVGGQIVRLALAVPAEDVSSLTLRISLAATPPTAGCLADVAGGGADNNEPDGVVDGTDFVAFINSFAVGDATIDPLADVAGGGVDGLSADGLVDGSDFIAFINAFSAGC